MTDKPVVLTAEMAQSVAACMDTGTADCIAAVNDIATGRTAVAHVLSEEECRAEFEALHADMVFVGDGMREFAYRWWKASRRAAGLVAEKKEGET